MPPLLVLTAVKPFLRQKQDVIVVEFTTDSAQWALLEIKLKANLISMPLLTTPCMCVCERERENKEREREKRREESLYIRESWMR